MTPEEGAGCASGPVRMKDVEEAQQKIVNVIRRLEDSAEIVISRGGVQRVVMAYMYIKVVATCKTAMSPSPVRNMGLNSV